MTENTSEGVFGVVKWASKEAREYVVTGTTLLVALQATGTLERLLPSETSASTAGAVKTTAEELAPAVREVNASGQVVIDPESVEGLVEAAEEASIGEAVVLECPYEGGCAVATPAAMPTPMATLHATDTGDEPMESMVPEEIVAVEPQIEFVNQPTFADQWGTPILVWMFITVFMATTIYKRVWRRLWARLHGRTYER